MTRTEAIRAMKVRIKELSAFQREMKKLGRSYKTPEQKAAYPGLIAALKENHGITSEYWFLGDGIINGKSRITVALNLYHELRGKPHCHNISQVISWSYARDLDKLRVEFAYEEPVLA